MIARIRAFFRHWRHNRRAPGVITNVSGLRVIHTARPGAQMKLLQDGCAVVAHPEEPPYWVDHQGHVHQL